MQPREFRFIRRPIAKILLPFLIGVGLCVGAPTAHAFWPFRSTAPKPARNPSPAPDQKELSSFTGTIDRMAEQLVAHLQENESTHDPLAEGIVVCSFVELKKLANTSSFGRYVAEQLMSEFQQRGNRVLELRKSTSILVQEGRGEYGLSRNAEEVPGRVASGAMLTGTYTVAGNHILVNARLIDNRTAALLSSATAVFSIDRLTASLLADRSFAASDPVSNEVIYLKRLEM
jgi:TolB-like protein